MTSQKSRSSTTSRALVARPRRDDSTDSPARSCLVNISPARPLAAWLWSIWRARVDLPQSIVPEKKTSSATEGNSNGCRSRTLSDVPRGHLDQGDRHLFGGQRSVKTQQCQQPWSRGPGVDDGDVIVA